MTLDVSIVPLSQSIPEMRTNVHILSLFSLKVVTLAIVVQVTLETKLVLNYVSLT